jgi:2-polyprenyl-3-methyl-5-hydroxy-6-metoxy-1,4-benzoquinol methylase
VVDSKNIQDFDNPAYSGDEELQNLEKFMPKYLDHISASIAEVVLKISGPKQILEFGAGRGAISQRVFQKTKFQPVCIEIDPNLIEYLRSSSYHVFSSLDKIDKKFELIYTVNVLEHILDDSRVLEQIYQKLNVNGIIIIFVPAFQFLISEMDKKVGHIRRYSKKELKNKVLKSGFEIKSIQYFDSLGILAALITKLVGYRGVFNLGGSTTLKFYDRYLIPISRLLDKLIFHRILGKNIILIGEKF